MLDRRRFLKMCFWAGLPFLQPDLFLSRLSESIAATTAESSNYGKTGFIDLTGEFTIPPIFDEAKCFSEGLAPVRIGNKWNYIDTAGSVVIDFQYKYAKNFSKGYASVLTEDGWGYIDKEGNFAIKPHFKSASIFTEGLACVSEKEGEFGYINYAGEYIIEPAFADVMPFHDGVARVALLNDRFLRHLFIDKSGEVIGKGFHSLSWFNEGLAPVRLEDKWVYIDKKNRIVMYPQVDAADCFNEGLACVRRGNEWGVINRRGDFVLEPHYRYLDPYGFSEGLIAVKQNENSKWGYMDKTGQIVIEEKFDDARAFEKEIACVKIGSRYGVISTKGKMIIEPRFSCPLFFNDGLDWVRTDTIL